jgi:hypothetical protein
MAGIEADQRGGRRDLGEHFAMVGTTSSERLRLAAKPAPVGHVLVPGT